MKNREIQKFARYEFKYILSKEVSDAIEKDVRNFMQYDGYVLNEKSNSYFVRSQYFDNDLLTHFFEKVDGMRNRYKYRIRTYGKNQSDSNPIFLEKKGRKLERTYKQRYQIDYNNLDMFYDPYNKEKLLEAYPNVDLIHDFVFDSIRKQTLPIIIVDYLRTPYVSDFDSNFRLTFDSSLTVAQIDQCNKIYNNQRVTHKLLAGNTILEVKFFRRFPPWFHKIIQSYNLKRLSISKFSSGIEVCGIAQDTGL